jgi:hypothetical protein
MAGGAALGAEVGGVVGAAVGGFTGVYLDRILHRSFAEFDADAKKRVGQMMASACEAASCTEAELEGRLLQSERTRLLNITAIRAAAGTLWPPKVVALGRLLAAGLIAEDEADIDLQQSALAAMTEMERPHVILLDLLVSYEPEGLWEVGWTAVPHASAVIEREFEDDRSGSRQWPIERRTWTVRQIRDVRPALAPALTGLLGTLRAHGLVEEVDSGPKIAQQLSEDLARQINREPESDPTRNIHAPNIPGVETSWSPTEHGVRVLGFYELAASEVEPGN